jgi:hypothetical protein
MSEPVLCKRSIADSTGYHFHPCNRPAKWLFGDDQRGWVPRCGLHSREHPWDERQRKPLTEAKP